MKQWPVPPALANAKRTLSINIRIQDHAEPPTHAASLPKALAQYAVLANRLYPNSVRHREGVVQPCQTSKLFRLELSSAICVAGRRQPD